MKLSITILALLVLSMTTYAQEGKWLSRLDNPNIKSKILQRDFDSYVDVSVAYETIEAQCGYDTTLLNKWDSPTIFLPLPLTVISSGYNNGKLSVSVLCVAQKK